MATLYVLWECMSEEIDKFHSKLYINTHYVYIIQFMKEIIYNGYYSS